MKQEEMKEEGKSKKRNKWEAHLVEEVFAIILVGDGNELLEILRPNTLDEFILGFGHSLPNFGSRPEGLGCILTVQPCCSVGCVRQLSLTHTKRSVNE